MPPGSCATAGAMVAATAMRAAERTVTAFILLGEGGGGVDRADDGKIEERV